MYRFLIAILPALLLLYAQQPMLALITFIVLGQGHFLLTYLYQWRAGKINTRYLLAYAIIAPLIFWFAIEAPFSILLLVTATIFSIHYFYDEARILEADDTGISFTLLIPPILFFVSYLLYEKFSQDLFALVSVLAVVLFASSYFRFGLKKILSPHVVTLNIIGLGILGVYIFNLPFSSEALLGAIIIHHYATWYIHQYMKLKPRRELFARYIHDVLVVNIILVLGFVLFRTVPSFSFLEYIFVPEFFYAWTILHILFTTEHFLRAIGVRLQSATKRFRLPGSNSKPV